MKDEILSADQVAERLHMRRQTVIRKAKKKQLPGFKLEGSKVWLFREEDLERYLAEQAGQGRAA